MSRIGGFTQPDASPEYFIKFLSFLDGQGSVKSIRAHAAQCLSLAAGHRVLDLGCGIGGATFPIADVVGPNGLAAGVDVSSAMIEAARERAAGRQGVEFHVGNATAIPFPDRFFDSARCERVFLYLPDRLAAIREMMRVVKPGGRICLVDTEIDSTAIYSTKPALTRKMTSLICASMPNGNSGRELPALARQAGLKGVQTDCFAITTPYEFFQRVAVGTVLKAAEDGLASTTEVEEWLTEQETLQERGEFFQMWLMVVASGTV
ncbi:MAG: methyltransferase domain-containing protein [Acidobacteria bacterium]|nr:methyltransferase domain-containing protein [Acidobacteriota bacterium]MBS1865290.1 methyltransferase domain-containing protein [Acidobacteriota bacterium]